MSYYDHFNIPHTCKVGNPIFKKLFYENADLSANDKKLFINGINKITWVYSLKPETININTFKDDIRDYPEVEVIEVELSEENRLKKIAEIIMKTIPYPMLLVFKLGHKVQLYVSHQRTNQNDISKNTLEEIINTDWLEHDSSLLYKLDMTAMRFTNYYTLYSDIVDTISVYKVSNIISNEVELTGEEARALTSKIESLDQQINALRVKLKKETQFNRKMELNIEIKKLERQKSNIIGGI